MAEKHFVQQFAVDFEGINSECAAIEAEGTEVDRALNYELGAMNALRGRVGVQGQYGTDMKFYTIFTHTYSRTQDEYALVYQTPAGVHPNQTPALGSVLTTADGATISRLVGINDNLWVQEEYPFAVTYVSGTYPFTWYSTVSSVTNSVHFILKENGATILDFDCGTGPSTTTNIYTLITQINALAQFNISTATRGVCPPVAITNGNQAAAVVGTIAYGTVYQITVNAGHTFSPGDLITWYEAGGNTLPQLGFVIATSGTTINYVGKPGNLINGQVIGYMAQWAGAFPIGPASSLSSGNLTLNMPYWRGILYGDRYVNYAPFDRAWETSWGKYEYFFPPTSVNAQGNLYIAGSHRARIQVVGTEHRLAKFDGAMVTNTGLPTPTGFTVTLNGVGALTGTYRYKVLLRRRDAQGNIWDGPLTNAVSITYAAQQGAVGVTGPVYTTASGYQVRCATKYTAESPAAGAFFYVDDNTGAPGNNGMFQIGDVVTLRDSTGALHVTRCTGYSGGAMRVADQSGYTIVDNEPISAGLTLLILRTTANGNTYYELTEIVHSGIAGSLYGDNITDAVLTTRAQYIEPEIGKEHDAPPQCGLVCLHQGLMVVARGRTSPNTVAYSTADGIEYFPIASNNFDIPSTITGPISAIASDTNDRLAVFKANAYYDVVGDLDAGAFSVTAKYEGDYGIASQASLTKIKGVLIGLSRLGYLVIADGDIDSFAFHKINARLINQNYRFDWAVAINDYFNRQYLCYTPISSAVSGEHVGHVLDYSREKFVALERSYATNQPSGGLAMLGDTLYGLDMGGSVYRRLPRFISNSPTGNDGDSFLDHVSAIKYILQSQPMTFGEPAVTKVPLRLRIWSIPNDNVITGWVPFSLVIETGPCPIDAYIGNSYPGGSRIAIAFADKQKDWFRDAKLLQTKAQFYIIRFTTEVKRESPFVVGYEVLYNTQYEKEDFIR